MLLLSSIKIDSFPSSNSISVLALVKPFMLPATAVAQAAVPQALVNPAPLSHTLTLIKLSLIILARVTLHFSKKIYDFHLVKFQLEFFENSLIWTTLWLVIISN